MFDDYSASQAQPLRCSWANGTPQMQVYHDTQWGFPVSDDQQLFEKICLEGFQAGLSWSTILNKRERFREVFANFDFYTLAKYTTNDIERLMQDPGIVRHRGKIVSTVNNAKRAIVLVEEAGSLAAFFWQYQNWDVEPSVAATSAESIALAKELKRRGWTFVGPTTIYAFMQSVGLVNDHIETCYKRKEVWLAQQDFSLERKWPLLRLQ